MKYIIAALILFSSVAHAADKTVEANPETSLKVSDSNSTESATADIQPIDEKKIEAELTSLGKKEKNPEKAQGASAATTAVTQDDASKPEQQIPVFKSAVKEAKPAESSGSKVVYALVILAAGLFGLWFYANKWMHKRNLKNKNTSIRVLTQHYIGPKKSLTIVSVAGETILLGVTDHNINMIKNLSLLDDEMPKDVSSSFSQTLNQAQAEEPDNVEDYTMKGVKEIVGERLKGMRNLW